MKDQELEIKNYEALSYIQLNLVCQHSKEVYEDEVLRKQYSDSASGHLLLAASILLSVIATFLCYLKSSVNGMDTLSYIIIACISVSIFMAILSRKTSTVYLMASPQRFLDYVNDNIDEYDTRLFIIDKIDYFQKRFICLKKANETKLKFLKICDFFLGISICLFIIYVVITIMNL